MDNWLRLLLSLSLSGTVLTLLAAGIIRLLSRRVSLGFQCALWLLVLLRFICPLGNRQSMSHLAVSQPVWTVIRSAPSDADRAGAQKPIQGSSVNQGHGPEPHAAGQLLTAVWASGASGLLLWRVSGYLAFRRRVLAGAVPASQEQRLVLETLAGEGRGPRLLVSAHVGCPMLLGLTHPCILLPSGKYPQPMLEGALRHELAHWRRHDLWLKWLGAAVACLHWFNPAVWWLQRQLSRACELACDEAVVQNRSRAERIRYGTLLLAMASGEAANAPPVSASLWTDKQQLKERLEWIMEPNQKKKSALIWMAGAVLALALSSVALGAYAGQGEPPAQPAAPEDPASQAAEGLSIPSAPELEKPATEALIWPLDQEDIVLTALYSTRVHPITGVTRTHSGIDMAAQQDTPVLAAAAGTVAETGYNSREGNFVELAHSGALSTRYCHLSGSCVEEGQSVAAGEQIGQAGSTGMSTGCHLHFEVKQDGVTCNPEDYLPGEAVLSENIIS